MCVCVCACVCVCVHMCVQIHNTIYVGSNGISSTTEITLSIPVEPSSNITVDAIFSSVSTVDSTQTVGSGAQSASLHEITPSTTAETSSTSTTFTSLQPSPTSSGGTDSL